MTTIDMAAKKVLRLNLKGIIQLIIDNKVVAVEHYKNQKNRKDIIGEWHEQFQLLQNDFILSIKPTI
jgi:hypothetical protein